MWSGPGVTGERPESVELTTLLTIKRQPDTASSSSPLLSKAGTANPCPPEERHSTANQPMSQAASQPVCQAGRKATKAPIYSVAPTSLNVLSFSWFLFLFIGFSFLFFSPIFVLHFCPIYSPVSHLSLPSVFLNHLPCHFSSPPLPFS